ncbi:hypothetical protein [Epilithonimonas hungarica]|uniref:Uncharacterized protein n=1 Tax=Epilithonimonas hungarica TaxID=454006 RepID=A0A1G7JXP2_9FLAO|nr:hypothetical protein [Epilithonimonas hungarica]SDF29309.1 hypothetical protein SAMN05421825_1502 [Epilithonimonas hungarica]
MNQQKRDRADRSEIAIRIGEIVTLLLKGENREDILRFSAEKFQIKKRMAENYLSKAQFLIEKSVEKNINYDYAKAIRRYEELYQKSLKEGDYRLAVSINKELANLQGLHKVQIEHSGEVKFICNVPD